jgi:hypothetical protein
LIDQALAVIAGRERRRRGEVAILSGALEGRDAAG